MRHLTSITYRLSHNVERSFTILCSKHVTRQIVDTPGSRHNQVTPNLDQPYLLFRSTLLCCSSVSQASLPVSLVYTTCLPISSLMSWKLCKYMTMQPVRAHTPGSWLTSWSQHSCSGHCRRIWLWWVIPFVHAIRLLIFERQNAILTLAL